MVFKNITTNSSSIILYPLLLNRKPKEIKCLTWEKVNCQYGRGHTNILSVIDLLLTLPASSAEVEQGFSQLKLLKTDMRSKLKESHLNDLMSMKLLSAPISEFDPTEAIDLWNTSGCHPRRPYFKETKHPGKATGGIRAQADSCPHVPAAVPAINEQTATVLVDKDDSATDAVEAVPLVPLEPLVQGFCEEGVEMDVAAADNSYAKDSADDSDSGVDSDSDTEERRVESLITKYL